MVWKPVPYTVHTPPVLLPTENVSIGLLNAKLPDIPTGAVQHADELDRLKSCPVLNMRTRVHNNINGLIISEKVSMPNLPAGGAKWH